MQVTVLSPEQTEAILAQTTAIQQLIESTNKLLDGQVALLAGLQHFTTKEVASFFHCTTRTVENWRKPNQTGQPKLLPVKIGSKVLYRGADLLAFSERLVNEQHRTQAANDIYLSLSKKQLSRVKH